MWTVAIHELGEPASLSTSVSNIILLGVRNIKFSGRCRRHAVHGGESVPRLTWPGPHVSRPANPPAHTTHYLQYKQLLLTAEVMNECKVCMATSLKTQAFLLRSHRQLQYLNHEPAWKQPVQVLPNNDLCDASVAPMGNMVWKNFRSKEFQAKTPQRWHPTHILLDPGSAGRGPQRTTAINNSLTRYSTQ